VQIGCAAVVYFVGVVALGAFALSDFNVNSFSR